MAAALRVFGRNRFLLSTKRTPLTLSLGTLQLCSCIARYEKDGWEFSLDGCAPPDCGPPEPLWLVESGLRMPEMYDDNYVFISHLHSGIRFSFNAYDAIRKSLKEKSPDPLVATWLEKKSADPLVTLLPSYGSILLPVVEKQYDSAYVGRVLIEKPGERPQYINPKWELIDWKTLHEQMVWTTNNGQISSIPDRLTYGKGKGPKTFVRNKRKAKKANGEDLLNAPVNYERRFYMDFYGPIEQGISSCNLYLVVTECGWSVDLYQLFLNNLGDKRIREMTMHCKFQQDIIYREIIERQSKNFEKRLSQVCNGRIVERLQDDEMFVHFHEAKQFNIQEVFMGGSSSHRVCPAKKYFPLSPGAWRRTPPGALDVSDDKVESLFANCGEKIKSIQKATGTHIQIIPLFRHPYNPKVDPKKISGSTFQPQNVPRTAYIHGSENDIASAKSRITMMNLPDLAY